VNPEDAPPTPPPTASTHSLEVEGTGETVGEAKWSALRELERRFPGLDKADVSFEVLTEGERGLLGVGYAAARVIARLAGATAAAGPPAREAHTPGSPAARLQDLLERICAAVGAPATVTVTEDESALLARISGGDLGLVIGKHGQTIDAIQYLANAIVYRGAADGERKEVVVDAAGYRDRRRAALEARADTAAEQALGRGEAVALEPMTAPERKIVHLRLQERADVATESEGTEPDRHVVVRPAVG
jgi:spoIIIJ-associated protein